MADEIAYIAKGFPRLSETFISNEVLLLEKLGAKIKLFSIKRPDEQLVQNTVSRIKATMVYLPRVTSLSNTFLLVWLLQNMRPFINAHLHLAGGHPFVFFRTLAKALAMTIIYRNGAFTKPRKIYIKEFIQAVFIADQINQSGTIRHIHAHFCHGATTIAQFVSSLTGVPFSFTAHAKDIYQKNQNPGDLLIKKINAASFVATCTGANKQYLDTLGDASKIKLIYHGLDINFFKPAKFDKQRSLETIQKILSVGRFVEKKGFHFLLEACAMLKNRRFKFHCRIIGEDGDCLPQLQESVERLGLKQYVSLEAPKAHEELMQIYQQSQLFALPCQIVGDGDRDGIPNVLVEAMASGLAVVSTEISGIPELIKHNHNGLLVREKSSRELADAIGLLLTDQTLVKRLSANARDTVLERFDSDLTTLQLKILFDNCIESQSVEIFGKEEISNASS
jgi:glycosyltransferase involved in cell wall biosynthesis